MRSHLLIRMCVKKKERRLSMDCSHIAVSRTSTVAQRAFKRSLIQQQRGPEQDENQQPFFIGQTALPPEAPPSAATTTMTITKKKKKRCLVWWDLHKPVQPTSISSCSMNIMSFSLNMFVTEAVPGEGGGCVSAGTESHQIYGRRHDHAAWKGSEAASVYPY